MRFSAIFLSFVHRIDLILHILIELNDMHNSAIISAILDQSFNTFSFFLSSLDLFSATISLVISRPHKGQLKSVFDLGATVTAVAIKPKLDCRITQSTLPQVGRNPCTPGRYRNTCSLTPKGVLVQLACSRCTTQVESYVAQVDLRSSRARRLKIIYHL